MRKPTSKNAAITAKFSSVDRQRIAQAATAEGTSVSDFLRRAALAQLEERDEADRLAELEQRLGGRLDGLGRALEALVERLAARRTA